MTSLPPLVNQERLREYLARRIPAEHTNDMPLRVERVRGGHSNETFFIGRGSQEWVLRRPLGGPSVAEILARQRATWNGRCGAGPASWRNRVSAHYLTWMLSPRG